MLLIFLDVMIVRYNVGKKSFLLLKSFVFPIIGQILFETVFLLVYEGSRISFQYLLNTVSK